MTAAKWIHDRVQPCAVAAPDLFEMPLAEQPGTGDGEPDLAHGSTQSWFFSCSMTNSSARV